MEPIYLIGQIVTCVLLIAGFWYQRHLLRTKAEELAEVVRVEKERVAALVLKKKEELDSRLEGIEQRIEVVENGNGKLP